MSLTRCVRVTKACKINFITTLYWKCLYSVELQVPGRVLCFHLKKNIQGRRVEGDKGSILKAVDTGSRRVMIDAPNTKIRMMDQLQD